MLPRLSPIVLGSLLGLSLAPPVLAQGYAVEEFDGRWRVSWEKLDTDAGDATVAGVHYEAFGLWGTSGLFAGVGAFGSIDGDIGNLFAGGVDLGWRQHVTERMSLQIGTFAGTSGGTLLQGNDGLAVRPFVAFETWFEHFGFRAELAQMNVAGVDFDDPVLSLGLTIPMNWLYARERGDWASPIAISEMDWERVSIGASVLTLNPDDDSRRIDGTDYADDLTLGGLRMGLELGPSSYLPFEAWGAVGGGVGGFRALLGGYGLRGPLWESALPGQLDWELEALAGVGGGGQVDVGAGLLLKGNAGLRARFARNWTANAALTYVDAVDGRMTGTGLQFGVAWDPRVMRLNEEYPRDELANRALPAPEGRLDVWEFSVASKRYDMRASSAPESGGNWSGHQYLFGIAAERHVSENASVLARAYGPIAGDIGGYSELLGGVRVAGSPFEWMEPVEWYVEYDFGAAGGGEVPVGSGFVHQLTTGLAWELFDGVELGMGIGRMNSIGKGAFDASVVEAGLAFDMARILARR